MGIPGNFGQKWPTPCWFERRRHSIANCSRMVTDSATVTMESLYRKLPSLFLMVLSLTPYHLPSPPNGGSICPQHTRMAISLQRVIWSTSCLVLGYGFRGRRIERRYLGFEQVQDGGHRHVGKISSGDISATDRPIHVMFCSRVGLRGRRI